MKKIIKIKERLENGTLIPRGIFELYMNDKTMFDNGFYSLLKQRCILLETLNNGTTATWREIHFDKEHFFRSVKTLFEIISMEENIDNLNIYDEDNLIFEMIVE